ncbi:nucleotidyltransferase family protein [Candidatus Woesearchaeota archaeon]|nr:nucleotidyltransferase family protein [Candidatus Woesearchaeota archaeon]
MKAIILAGGYAKRLWPLTKDTPKPLLKVGDKEIITRIIEKINLDPGIDEIIISTNAKFGKKFEDYLKDPPTKKKTSLIVEPTMAEGEKLGSIGGLQYIIDHMKLDHDALIIGGDNLFEFDLKNFIDYHNKLKATTVALRDIKDRSKLKNFGVCVLDKDKRIIEFQEKPSEPKSTYASTACYVFTNDDLKLIKRYLDEGNSPDAMGFFITWLIKKSKVYGYLFDGLWYDIGSLEGLEEARKIYAKK